MRPVEGVYGGHIGKKIPVRGELEAIPEVEIWRRHVFLTQRSRLTIRLVGLYIMGSMSHLYGSTREEF